MSDETDELAENAHDILTEVEGEIFREDKDRETALSDSDRRAEITNRILARILAELERKDVTDESQA